MKEGLPG